VLIFNRPAYSGLTNNVSTKLQKLKGFPWKEGTGDFVNVRAKQEYIQSYSKHFGVEPLIRYNTRVEKLEKVGGKWLIKSTTLIREGSNKGKHVNEVEVSGEKQTVGLRLTIHRNLTMLL
jgi:urease beta subunit